MCIRDRQWRGRFDLALAGSHQLMYRYNPFDGSLELAGDLQGAFGMQADAIPTLDALLALAHPDDRARLTMHWAAVSYTHLDVYKRQSPRSGS